MFFDCYAELARASALIKQKEFASSREAEEAARKLESIKRRTWKVQQELEKLIKELQ